MGEGGRRPGEGFGRLNVFFRVGFRVCPAVRLQLRIVRTFIEHFLRRLVERIEALFPALFQLGWDRKTNRARLPKLFDLAANIRQRHCRRAIPCRDRLLGDGRINFLVVVIQSRRVIEHEVAVNQLVELQHRDSLAVLSLLRDVDVRVVALVVVLAEIVLTQAKC